jgi:predicted anti-sigma-YlaC factor YlaD
MSCEQFREAASARLDGEAPDVPDMLLDAHLAGCVGCAGWYAAARRVTRLARIAPAEAVPDLSEAVLAAVGPVRRRLAPGELLVRGGLGLLALAQLLLAWPALLGQDAMAHSLHSAHELGAWNAALGIAVAWTALRPRHAAGLLPLLVGVAGVLTVTSALDLHDGDVAASRVSTHLLVWCAVALVVALVYVRREPRPLLGGRGGGVRPSAPVRVSASMAVPPAPESTSVPRPAAGRTGAGAVAWAAGGERAS